MAYVLDWHDKFLTGAVLDSPADLLPPGALRTAINVRIDRHRGVLTNREGMSRKTILQIDSGYLTGLWLSRLYGPTDYSYVQLSNGSASRIYRMNSAWNTVSKVLIQSPASLVPVSDINWKDGMDGLWKYAVGPSQWKDNGTIVQNFGIVGPSDAPSIVGIGTRERIAISSFDDHTDWGFNTGVSGKGNDTNFVQEGSSSMSVSIAAGDLGTVAIGLEGANAFVNGTDNSGVNDKTNRLVDTTKNFVTIGVRRGSRVRNETDGSEGFVTRISTTTNPNDTLFFDDLLFGGAGNDFDSGDTYEIYFNLETFGIEFASGTDNGSTSNRTDRIIDTTKHFKSLNVAPGMRVWNKSNGSTGIISSLAQTINEFDTLICAGGFTGSSENDFDAGDGYTVHNELEQDDDWIFMWARVDFPHRVEFLQVDFDCEQSDVNASNAFNGNMFTIQLPGSIFLNQGRDQWTELYLRKSEFRSVGEADWRQVRACRLSAQVSRLGGCTIWFDDLSLIGGYGLEGEYEYTAVYRNNVTGCRSAPPKTEDETVLWTQKIELKRHAPDISFGNINNPADTQINELVLYRRGGKLPAQPDGTTAAYMVDRITDNTTVYRDRLGDSLLLSREVLEVDNDPPPDNAVVMFGPGAYSRAFAIYDRNKVAFSKAWEEDESRAENWPQDWFFLVGDGSYEALNGLVVDTNGFVWTTEATWAFTGRGIDTFLPVRIPGSRGLAARYALAFGDGQVFFLSQDGIHSQRGMTQVKLTEQIKKFFMGLTVDGQAGLSLAHRSNCRLIWYAHPDSPSLVLLYQEATTLFWKILVLKRNAQTGQYTDPFFDFSLVFQSVAHYVDAEQNELLALTATSHVIKLEDGTVENDDGNDMPIVWRSPAFTQGSVRNQKTYNDVIIEANTGSQDVAVTAYFDKGASSVSLGTMNTSTDTAQTISNAVAMQAGRDIALRCDAMVGARVEFFGYGWHYLVEPEQVTRLDSDELSFQTIHQLWKLVLDIDASTTVTVNVYLDGSDVPYDTQTLTATTRQIYTLEYDDPVLRSKLFRVTLTASGTFQVYDLTGWFRPEPEDVFYWDSGRLTSDRVHALKYLNFDIDAPADATITILVGGTAITPTYHLAATVGRQRVTVPVRTGIKGRDLWFQVESTSRMQVWGLLARLKPWGVPLGSKDAPVQIMNGAVVQHKFPMRAA